MKIIFGLGNPDKKYLTTRHNIGFIILDKLAQELNISFSKDTKFQASIAQTTINNEKIILVKPLTYMNLSGIAVSKIIKFYDFKIEDCLVITDDIALPVSQIRLRESGGHGGHNGLRSIIDHCGNTFKRLRVGIDYDERLPLEVYVLSNFNKVEVEGVKESIVKSLGALTMFINNESFTNIMNKYNLKT